MQFSNNLIGGQIRMEVMTYVCNMHYKITEIKLTG